MAKNSILMTVFNRSPEVLDRTLAAVAESNLDGCEMIIVDDGSTLDYSELKDRYAFARWIRIEADEYPRGTFTLPHEWGGVYNNPALALNRAIASAEGERLIFLASDCIVPPGGILAAKNRGRIPWFSTVYDSSDGRILMGASRPVPYHWFLSVERSTVIAIGGFDQEYLKGIACEDDDFGAMLALYAGAVVFGLTIQVEHQYHERWIDVDQARSSIGYDRSLRYMMAKWNGMPWPLAVDGSKSPLDVKLEKQPGVLVAHATMKQGYIDPLAGRRMFESSAVAVGG